MLQYVHYMIIMLSQRSCSLHHKDMRLEKSTFLKSGKLQLLESEDTSLGLNYLRLCASMEIQRVTTRSKSAGVSSQFGPQGLQVLVEGFMNL